MRTECARQLCDRHAVALYTIEPSASVVWLISFTTGVVGTPLCRSHADRLAAPVGWTIRDERPPAERSISEPPADDSDPEPAELEDLLDARTPLLSRAFRGVAPAQPDESTRSHSAT